MKKLQLLALALIAALIGNFLMMLFFDWYFFLFWIVIIAIGIFAFKALPRLNK